MEKMKVLFATSWYPSRLHPTNGNFVERHAKAVQSAGHEVVVAHLAFSNRIPFPQTEVEQVNGLLIYHLFLPKWMFGLDILSKKFFGRFSNKLMAMGFVPDLIHGNVIYPVGKLTEFLKGKLNIPVVFTEHWTGYRPENSEEYNPQVEALIQGALTHIDKLMPVSHELVGCMKNKGLKGSYRVVNNAVDPSLFYPIEPDNQEFRFLHVSHFGPKAKNTDGIIEAFANAGLENCRLFIAGDGDLVRLQEVAVAKKLDLSQIDFTGSLAYAEVAKLMQQSHCHVLFSNYENLPCVIAESHCCGVPVIATDVGGVPEMINDNNGLMVKPKNIEALTAALQRLKSNYNHYNKQAIAKSALERYSYPSIGAQFTEVYKEVIEAWKEA